ncbi:hypothetical protein GGI20_001700 [Coemansia sp. BCRC 34301]|nr:hypothetical protein GGI20_001700 [Coemansia sp. BCRC 34301]
MNADSSSELSSAAVDALFRNCRLSLRIPDIALSKAGDYTMGSSDEWTLNEVMGDMPTRRFLYYGEKTQVFVAATIPNLEHLRWTLAAAMLRTEAPELSQGKLALSVDDCKQFFSMLDFCVTAFEAIMAPPSTSSGQLSWSQQPKMLGVSSVESFLASVPLKETGYSESLRIGTLKDGAWCCVYPFSIDTPLPSNTAAGHFANSALSFEIRAACSGVDSSLQMAYANQPIGRNALSGRTAHLEELAIRVSSAVFAHGRSTPSQSRLLASSESKLLETAGSEPSLAPEMPRRMFQALVLTKPIVNVGSQVTELPPSFGTGAMLVTVSVQCDATSARSLVLRTTTIQSSEWHIQLLPAQPSLPFALTSGSRWQSIYKLSPLAISPKEDAFRALSLLNIGVADAELPGRESDGAITDPMVHVLVEATGSNQGGGVVQTFRVAHRVVSNHQSTLASAYAVSTPDYRRPSAVLSQVHPSTRPERSSSIAFNQATHVSVDQKPLPLSSETPAGGLRSNMLGSMAIGATAVVQPAQSSSESTFVQSSRYKARAASMLKIPACSRRSSFIFSSDRPLTSPIRVHHVPPVIYGREVLNEQRARADTIDALSIASQSRSSISASTVRSESTSNGRVVAVTPGLKVDRAFANESDTLPCESDLGVPLGTLGLSFEASPKANLGENIAVHVRIFNNTNIQYSRLCLVDDSSELGPDYEEYGDMAGHGLLSLDHITAIPPLQPGESTSAVLHYVAASPHFHVARPVRLLDQEAGGSAGQTLAIFESPFIVYVDDGDDSKNTG